MTEQNNLGAATPRAAHPLEWRFRAASSKSTLRIEVRALADLDPGRDWGRVAGFALGRLRLEPLEGVGGGQPLTR